AAAAKSLAKLSTAAREKLARQREAETRRLRLAGLLEVAAAWRDPSRFSDLADALLRDAIGARDWDLVAEFARGLGARLTPTLDARANYVAGRAEELGLRRKTKPAAPSIRGIRPSISDHEAEGRIPSDAETGPAANYRAILARPGVSPYYRILAAHRLGESALSLPPGPRTGAGGGILGGATGASGGSAGAAASSGAVPGPAGAPAAAALPAETFVQGFFDFGLGGSAFAEAKPLVPELDQDALRRLSTRFAEAGLHADSMRLALLLSERPDWEQRREDYERIYPRPFLEELRSIRPKAKVPEHVLFGLIRSESFFRPDVVSHAGAVGLSQLMPATAAEQARKMGLAGYDLRAPKDNLRIGADHFEELLAETGNHPLRAMWAYNAGRGRLKRWLAESPDLPDDLLLEALGIEETRQYGRNILQAATMYAELYYGIDEAAAVDEMLGERTR
ncbi:MAG: lytic transglycosylase domain-containing protein, partial [Spirochaetaceae bacterium]|nr:lytic transglycosylase domain-containing protein [Spirochaetaceae bacterium]